MSQDFSDDCFASGHVAQTDMQNVENNFAALKSSFSGGSAPANLVAGMPWFDTDTDQLWIRNKDNDQWLSLGFVPGTVMLFGQNSAPLGWTRKANWQDNAMLCYAASGNIGSGGSYNPQSEQHTHTTGDHALTINEMPAHTHTIVGQGDTGNGGTGGADATGSTATSSTGGGAAHNHGSTGTSTAQPYYQEVIAATKD